MAHLRAFSPPTLETMSECWFRQARGNMALALRNARAGALDTAYLYLGIAQAAVSVCYDTGHARAYGAVVALNRTRRAIDAHVARKGNAKE